MSVAVITDTNSGLSGACHQAMVLTVEYGGRITPAAAMIGGVLKIKPILQIQGNKLDAYAKSRHVRTAKRAMLDAVAKGIDEEFGGISYHDQPGAWIGLAYTQDKEAALQFYQEAQERFPGFDIYMDRLPISIACHIGPGALALTCTGVLEENMGTFVSTDSEMSSPQ